MYVYIITNQRLKSLRIKHCDVVLFFSCPFSFHKTTIFHNWSNTSSIGYSHFLNFLNVTPNPWIMSCMFQGHVLRSCMCALSLRSLSLSSILSLSLSASLGGPVIVTFPTTVHPGVTDRSIGMISSGRVSSSRGFLHRRATLFVDGGSGTASTKEERE